VVTKKEIYKNILFFTTFSFRFEFTTKWRKFQGFKRIVRDLLGIIYSSFSLAINESIVSVIFKKIIVDFMNESGLNTLEKRQPAAESR
jgi:hypothetical protein